LPEFRDLEHGTLPAILMGGFDDGKIAFFQMRN